MSQTKSRRTSWVGWIVSALLVVGSIWLWTERQYVVDAIQYNQYTPTATVKDVADNASLTNQARFIFYATRPSVESSEAFNQHCQRKEADSPILGCYASDRIYIFNVTDERLKGIKAVTAAHELLHAEYDRLPDSEKKRLQPLLQAAYKKVANSDLETRMKYYEKTEPGESFNELHSILGTEYASLGSELENYYKQYFNDRQALVALHQTVEQTFDGLSEEADTLVNQIEKLAYLINSDSKLYNTDVQTLNAAVTAFNARAQQTGGFTTQQEFQAARAKLLSQSNDLGEFRQRIQANIAEYKTLLAKLDSINSESASLNASLDSTLSDVPKI
jgi:uncharacterized protein YoxC